MNEKSLKSKDTRSDRRKAQDFADYVYAVKTRSLDKIEKLKKEKGSKEAQYEAEDTLEFIEEKYKDYAKYMETNEKILTEEVIKKLKGYIIANY